ncbi:MAG: hypothetical protein ACLPM3_00600 [Terracidiphilus sp.]
MQNQASGGESSSQPGSSALDRLTGFLVAALSRGESGSAAAAAPVAAVEVTRTSTSIALSLLGRLVFVTVVVLVAEELLPSQLGLFGRILCGIAWGLGVVFESIDAASKEPVISHEFAAGFLLTVVTFLLLTAKLPFRYRVRHLVQTPDQEKKQAT